MAPEFQKIWEKIAQNYQTIAFIDNVSNGTIVKEEDRMKEVEDTIKALNDARSRLKLEDCKIATTKIREKASDSGKVLTQIIG